MHSIPVDALDLSHKKQEEDRKLRDVKALRRSTPVNQKVKGNLKEIG